MMAVAAHWSALGDAPLRSVTWSSQGVTFTLQTLEKNDADDWFAVMVSAVEFGTTNQLPLGPVDGVPSANPFAFQAPPEGGTTAETLALAKQMVEDAVLYAARQRGWAG